MREFKVFRALGLAFRAWFRSFVPFTLLGAALFAPVFFWIATLDLEGVSTVDDAINKMVLWPIYAAGVMSTLLAPLLIYRVVQDLNGKPVSMLASIKFGVRGFLPAIMLAIATGVLGAIPGGAIIGAIVNCIWFVAAPAAVAEKLGPFAALGRSAQLTKDRRLGIFGLNFLLGLAFFAIVIAWAIPVFQGADSLDDIRLAALGIVGTFGGLHMFTSIVAAVSYVLLRGDKDGISHEELGRVFD